MSYNGIGLQSVRGSGTSGYVQTNLSTKDSTDKNYKYRQMIKKRKHIDEEIQNCKKKQAEARVELNQHDLHRFIDVKCMELRDELEDASEDEEVIVEKVAILRKKLESEQQNNSNTATKSNDSDEQSKEEPRTKEKSDVNKETDGVKSIRIKPNAKEFKSNKLSSNDVYEYKPRYRKERNN